MPLSYSRALQVIDFVGQLGKLRADGIGAPARARKLSGIGRFRLRLQGPKRFSVAC